MAYDIAYITDFTGGENTVSAPDQLLPNQVLAAQNVDLPLRGGFTKRLGSVAATTGFPAAVVRLIEFEYISGADRVRKLLALCADGNMYLSTTPTVVAYAWGNAYHCDYEVYRNNCYLIGGGKFVVWNGLTFNTVTNAAVDSNLITIAKCQLIEQRGERLFAAGNAEEPNTLYFSEVSDPTYWKVISAINAVTDDADTITAFKEFFDALVVFKTRAIYAWNGWDPNDDVVFNRLGASCGTRAYRSVQYVGNKLVYLGDDGLYALNGTYKGVIATERLTPYHTPEFKTIYRPAAPTPAFYNPTHACVFDGKYLLSTVQGAAWLWSGAVPGDGTLNPLYPYVSNTDVLVLNVDALLLADNLVQISTYKGWNVSSWCPSFAGVLYGAQGRSPAVPSSGAIRQYQIGYNDAGDAYTVYVKTSPQAQGEPVKRKKYRYAYVWMRQFLAEPSNMDVTAIVDYNEITTEIDPDESGVWDKDDPTYDIAKFDFIDLVTRKLPVKKRGKRLMFEFEDTSIDQALQVYGIGVEYRIKKPEKV